MNGHGLMPTAKTCDCDYCSILRDLYTQAEKRQAAKDAEALARLTHGTAATYNAGCLCFQCRLAKHNYRKGY